MIQPQIKLADGLLAWGKELGVIHSKLETPLLKILSRDRALSREKRPLKLVHIK